jgi:tetratricopeptide (TPR) repeat protein
MASLMVMYLPTVRTQDEPLDLLKQAKECLEAQQVDKGLALISKAIAMNPDFAEAYHLRAREYINIKEFQKAAGDCSRLIALRPDAAEGYMLRGFAYLSLHEPDKAVIDLSKAIEIWPKVVDGYMMRAIAYADLKDFANSTRDCTRAIALSPDMPFLYFTRATSERLQPIRQQLLRHTGTWAFCILRSATQKGRWTASHRRSNWTPRAADAEQCLAWLQYTTMSINRRSPECGLSAHSRSNRA